jgi:hypothetical protein
MEVKQLDEFHDCVTKAFHDHGHHADLFEYVPLETDVNDSQIFYEDSDCDDDEWVDGISDVAEQLIYMCEKYGMGMIKMSRALQGHRLTCTITCTKNKLTSRENIMVVNINDIFTKESETQYFYL